MENKKELLKAIDEQTKRRDLSYYIFVSDKGLSVNAGKKEIMVLMTTLLNVMYHKGTIKLDDIKEIVTLGTLSTDELTKKAFDLMQEEMKQDNKSFKDILDEILGD